MRTTIVSAWLVAALAAACAHESHRIPERARSSAEHLALAEKCEAAAARHERAAKVANQGAETFVCDHGAMTSQTTSGTEPVTHWAPCWSYDLGHTPFFHRDDIAYAVAERDGDRIRGAKVVFNAVPGLDATWMRMALTCHHARAATLGYPPTYMSYDPSVLEHVRVTVDDREGHVVVTLVSDDDVDGAVAWARAAALCGPMPAE